MNDDFGIADRSEDQPYEVTSFAKKHGLTIRAADAVLFANGPSRIACDTAALALLCAVAQYAKKQSAH